MLCRPGCGRHDTAPIVRPRIDPRKFVVPRPVVEGFVEHAQEHVTCHGRPVL
jgi:hypothetical protein